MVQLKPGVGLIGSTEDTTGAPLPLIFRSRAEDIVRYHEAAERYAGKAIEHAAECGRALIGLKEDLGHGGFIPFIEEHLPFTRQTASGYMRIANAIDSGQLQMEGTPSIRGALKQLSMPKEPIEEEEPPSGLDTLNRLEWRITRADEKVAEAGVELVAYADEIQDEHLALAEAARRYGFLLQAEPAPWGPLAAPKAVAKAEFHKLLHEPGS